MDAAATVLASLLLLLLLGPRAAAAQEGVPLFLVNEETTVSSVDFLFPSTRTFETSRLKERIATQGPSFLDRVRRVLPFTSMAPHPFVPIELQRDVVRLRTFYRNHGFLQPTIGYQPSVLDTSSNALHVIFSVEEGPPLIIQDVTFYGPDSTDYAVRQFSEERRDEWIALRDANPFRIGERYTDFTRTRIEDAVLRGLKNEGYAFAQVGSDTQVDSTTNTVDLRFFVSAGPRARVSDIQIEGNESVSREVVLRELPFKVGDWYSSDDVAEGQRELFGLQLFRVALSELPPQPRDSTVTVRYNVREASLRYVTAEGGYGTDLGVTGDGRWTHRNFFGDAREFSAGLIAYTGLGATTTTDAVFASRLFRASTSLRQPYLFSTKLSGVASVFAEFRSDPQLVTGVLPQQGLRLNAGQVGLSTTAIYEIMPYRTASLQYTLSRTLQLRTDANRSLDPAPTDPLLPPSVPGATERRRDIFNRSVFSATATLGQADDYVNPSRGFLVRPLLEAGLNLPLNSGVEYLKGGGQISGYYPLSDGVSLAGRLAGGVVWPYGGSQDALDGSRSSAEFLRYENRFDPIFYYAGGSSDVRGWPENLAGSKVARRVLLTENAGESDARYVYEAVGGTSKASFSTELRLPFPGLGSSWGTAVFLDGGQVWGAATRFEDAPDDFAFSNFLYGTGGGLRYQTPVGYLRLDLAYKLNPIFEDLRDAEEVFEYDECRASLVATGCEVPGASGWRRLRLHLSIGQSF